MKTSFRTILIPLVFAALLLSGCASSPEKAETDPPVQQEDTAPAGEQTTLPAPVPDRDAQKSSRSMEDKAGYRLKPIDMEISRGRPYMAVGAEIVTKEGKVPLTEIIKKLAELKGFSISWADDVDQTQPVDVHIRPEDNFWAALDNVLRQLDYFYETDEDTIVVRYKVSKRYHLSLPDLNETLNSSLGGNMLPTTGGGGDVETADTGIEANVNFSAKSEKFSPWDNIRTALDEIAACEDCPVPIIDSSLGMITVNAPRRIHKDVEQYLSSLRGEAYKQVVIEAKLLEVSLTDEHREGINWDGVFNETEIQGSLSFGQLQPGGLIYTTRDLHVGKVLRDLTVPAINLDIVVSAFKDYGDTRIISNPKINLLNGHSAVLSSGQNRQYLSGCEVTTNENGFQTAEPETNSVTEGLSIGIKANIIENEEVILYIFPAITRLIELRNISQTQCGTVQAPETAVRQMATFAKVKNNQVLVIGGIISKSELEATNKVPYLGDIPLVGKVFREEHSDKRSTELVIILKPKIISETGYVVEEVS